MTDFVDSNCKYIIEKKKYGQQFRAFELPGLWNGAMAYWNTVFVSIPHEIFNPVKTVTDLLNRSHHPKRSNWQLF